MELSLECGGAKFGIRRRLSTGVVKLSFGCGVTKVWCDLWPRGSWRCKEGSGLAWYSARVPAANLVLSSILGPTACVRRGCRGCLHRAAAKRITERINI